MRAYSCSVEKEHVPTFLNMRRDTFFVVVTLQLNPAPQRNTLSYDSTAELFWTLNSPHNIKTPNLHVQYRRTRFFF